MTPKIDDYVRFVHSMGDDPIILKMFCSQCGALIYDHDVDNHPSVRISLAGVRAHFLIHHEIMIDMRHCNNPKCCPR